MQDFLWQLMTIGDTLDKLKWLFLGVFFMSIVTNWLLVWSLMRWRKK